MNGGWQSHPHPKATQLDSYVASIYDAIQKGISSGEDKSARDDAALLEENHRLKNALAYYVEEE